jgi:hypothetical protein
MACPSPSRSERSGPAHSGVYHEGRSGGAPRKALAKLQIAEGMLGVIEKAFRERRKSVAPAV